MLTYRFSFFFNLVEKNSFTVKCRENGIDRLRNGNLPTSKHKRLTIVPCYDKKYVTSF